MKEEQKTRSTDPVEVKLMLDSGAHALYTEWVMKPWGPKEASSGNLTNRLLTSRLKGDVYGRYETDEFWEYVNGYCEFLKGNREALDYYVSVDVIFNPKLSWRVLKYMEKEHGLNPVPVIHWGTPIKWVKRHLKEGYELLGIGGLGQEANRVTYKVWADKVFSVICPLPQRMPVVKTHGFAMTAFDLMLRYPWWSVDSATWVKLAAYGAIYVPRRKQGAFTFKEGPLAIHVSGKSSKKDDQWRHYCALPDQGKCCVEDWLGELGVPLGLVDEEGNELEWGVVSNHEARTLVNLRYFMKFAESLPEWPWPFAVESVRRGFFS